MISLCLLSAIILGALIGSFLNVVIYRYNTGLSVATGRSQCFVCGKKLEWYELIPLFSFLFQRGRCTVCHTKISWQYPFVEIMTALLFFAVAYRQIALYEIFSLYPNGFLFSVLLAVYYFIIISVMVVIAVYDMRHKIIPDGMVYSFIFLAIGKLLFFTYLFAWPLSTLGFLNLLAPFLLAFPFAFLWFISRGLWIGFGDAKLALGIGALLGLAHGISAIMIAFWIGAVYGIVLMLVHKLFPARFSENIGPSSEIPFAPFLIIGTCIVLFTQIDVLGIMQFLNV
jgi:leader peptidase (prepilin peptidase)/N-methyltransferase